MLKYILREVCFCPSLFVLGGGVRWFTLQSLNCQLCILHTSLAHAVGL
uniref:Uncharacterized protein n=1 Tax=Anguilla anguilla TaxID=7936 RepID=A0A0E9VHZ8_ANGAN